MKKFILIICSLLVSSISVFGQDALDRDLLKSFKNYDLVKLDNQALIEKANAEQPVEIQAYGRYFEFVLIPNDLRAIGYRAVETTDFGERESQQSGEVTTYKGKLIDDADSEVRFTITEGSIEGFIYTGDNKKFFVARAEKFSKHAGKNDAVVYAEDDLLKNVDLSEDTENSSGDIERKMDFGLDVLKPQIDGASAAAADIRMLEVATEADYQWTTQSGGAAAANNEILGILNLVDGIYRRDLNLTISVTYQHTWSTADPYSAASTQALLDSFLSYWNANYPASRYSRDAAHLFTGKFSYQGIAYTGVTCAAVNYAYGLTGRSGTVNHLITAHEIAHNLGADHTDNSGSCTMSLMNPSLSSGVTGFCDASKTQIANYVAAHGSCLSSAGTVNVTPPPIPAPTPSCTYSITTDSQSFGAVGATGSVTVTTQSGCSWTAAANQNFVSVILGNSGSGSGSVLFYVADNTSLNPRSAALMIAGQTFTINQAAAARRKKMLLSPLLLLF